MKIGGAWVGWGLGDESDEIAKFKTYMRGKFSYAKALTADGRFDDATLTPKEKVMVFPAAALGSGLFLGGAAFSYFVVLPQTLEFFFKDAQSMNWQPTWTVREYYSFATQFVISFGLAFELPLAVLLLVKLGIVDHELLNRTRAFAVVVIFVLAALITPTSDILTLLLMGGPMYVLYEICIGIAWLMGKKKTQPVN